LAWPFRYLHKKADFVFSYGGNITRYIKTLGVPADKIVEIPGAVEADWLRTEPIAKKTNDRRKLFFIGRFERRKGVEEINQALMELDTAVDFEFHFAGPIPEHKKISFPQVKYHGLLTSKEQIVHLMDQMDVLVCPSYSEGMPNVIMEAMSRGCAVIATDVGAVPLLVNQQNGWLIKPASITALKTAMAASATASGEALENMGRASVERIAKDFTWDTISKRTATFFRHYL
jgi:glycosyltransferase involved in cell wall biosynthesis